MQDANLSIYEPQNLRLLSDLNELYEVEQKKKEEDDEADEAEKDVKEEKPNREFKITSDILNTLLKESKIFSQQEDKVEQNEDIHQLSQKTMIMKLIHYQLENNSQEFLKSLKESKYYK